MPMARPNHGRGSTVRKLAPGLNKIRGRLKMFSMPNSGPSLPYFVNGDQAPSVGSSAAELKRGEADQAVRSLNVVKRFSRFEFTINVKLAFTGRAVSAVTATGQFADSLPEQLAESIVEPDVHGQVVLTFGQKSFFAGIETAIVLSGVTSPADGVVQMAGFVEAGLDDKILRIAGMALLDSLE